MAHPSTEDTVTIERGYLETLVRRANLVGIHSIPIDFKCSCNRIILTSRYKNPDDTLGGPLLIPNNVSISEDEYNGLKKIAAQYANLRRNIMRGGVDGDTVDLLSQDDTHFQTDTVQQTSTTRKEEMREHGGVLLKATPHAPPAYQETFRPGLDTHAFEPSINKAFEVRPIPARPRQGWIEPESSSDDVTISVDSPLNVTTDHVQDDNQARDDQPCQRDDQQYQQPSYDRQCTRTITLTNLPDGTTYLDITNVVRGGQLLDIFLRSNDRACNVSFLHAVDARAFFDHVKKYGVYIKDKRVDIRWHDRQFILSHHVALQVQKGTTRNFVIRRCGPNHNARSIRDDVEHIHNLAVIKIDFIGSSCYVRTNSVNNAMYARTCMTSRAKYKGSKIEWDADECAQPLESPLQKVQKDIPTPKRATELLANRFHLLELDGDEDDDDDEDEITSTFRRAKRPVGIAA